MRRREERSEQGQTNNQAKQHSTPKAVTLPNMYVYPSTVDPSLFQKKEVPPRVTKKKHASTLAVLLEEYDKRSANPFFEYSRFNGEVGTIICT